MLFDPPKAALTLTIAQAKKKTEKEKRSYRFEQPKFPIIHLKW